jgi:DNA primase
MKNQIEQFQRELSLSPYAQQAIGERNFSQDTIQTFQIGFCPAFEGFEFDLLNGRVVLPLHDAYNEVIAFAGRRIDHYSIQVKDYYKHKTNSLQGLEKYSKWKSSKWINTPYTKSSHLFNLNRAKKHIYEIGYCILVEGYYDVMRLHELGFPNTLALCGTSISETQCNLISRYCNKVLIMLDGDDAGQMAAEKNSIKTRQNNLFTNIAKLPLHFDPDNLDQNTLKLIHHELTISDKELYIKL